MSTNMTAINKAEVEQTESLFAGCFQGYSVTYQFVLLNAIRDGSKRGCASSSVL